MKLGRLFLLTTMAQSLFAASFFLSRPINIQQKGNRDTLYERLKKTNINSMTQREYDYFMLMKKNESSNVDSPSQQHEEINGVVTYFFNDNFGYLPDVGSEVYVLPEKFRARSTDVSVYCLQITMGAIAKTIPGIQDAIQSKMMTNADFDSLCLRVKRFIEDLRSERFPDIQKTVAKGDGSFSVRAKPGKYFLIVRSAHLDFVSSNVERMGQIDIDETTVKINQARSVNFKFKPR